ncbi:MAG TPA: beta-propeller fold lactonase family protein [Kofleriaceae bacterium]|nr:beta-propeller fold lactonase family protein [Kofleriaceae bacterium]
MALDSGACSSSIGTASEFQADSVQAQVNAYVANENSGTVSVIDTASNTITASIAVGSVPASVALTPNRAFLYVANAGDSTVSVVDTATNTVATTVPVGNTPLALAITPDGAFVYVANVRGNSVSVIDTATNTVVATIPAGRFPISVAFTPDGTFAYVANEGDSNVSVIATATNTVVATVTVGNVPDVVAVSPDGALVYVGDIVTPPSTGGITVIDPATNTAVASVATSNQPDGIVFTANSAVAYVANFVGTSVSVIDTATTTVTATISSAQARTPAGVAITPDGAFVYAANFNSSNVSVIDTATNTIVALIPGLSGPISIAITPNRAPKASCHDVTVAAGPSCTATASVDNGSSDPDGDPLTLSQAPPAPYSPGATGVTLTVTDDFGASDRCTATVTVVDTTPPAITCPANVTAKGNIPNSPFANVDPGTPTATDNCAGPTVTGTRSDGQPLDAPYPFGTTTITRTATDAGGNQASCQQTITVVPNTPTSVDQCKHGGWQTFTNPTFKNQGDCVSFVVQEKLCEDPILELLGVCVSLHILVDGHD